MAARETFRRSGMAGDALIHLGLAQAVSKSPARDSPKVCHARGTVEKRVGRSAHTEAAPTRRHGETCRTLTGKHSDGAKKSCAMKDQLRDVAQMLAIRFASAGSAGSRAPHVANASKSPRWEAAHSHAAS